MIDFIFTAASVAFFVISLAYSAGCERLREGNPHGGKRHA